jgi:hypothetical protein
MNALDVDVLARLFDDAPPLVYDEAAANGAPAHHSMPDFPELDDDELDALAGLAMASVMYEGTGLPPSINPENAEHLGGLAKRLAAIYRAEAEFAKDAAALDVEVRDWLESEGLPMPADAANTQLTAHLDEDAESDATPAQNLDDDAAANASLTTYLDGMLAHLQDVVAPALAEREAARLEAERIEAERIAAAKAERARVEAERQAAEVEKARLEKERKAAERVAKAEKAAAEQAATEAAAAEQARIADEAERLRAKQLARDLPYEVAANRQRDVGLVPRVQWLVEEITPRKDLHGADIKVCNVLALKYYNSKRGRAWPSYETLAKVTGLHRNSVKKTVNKLDKLGLVIKQGGHTGKSNYYIPNFVPDLATTSNINGLEALTTSTPQCPTHGHPSVLQLFY